MKRVWVLTAVTATAAAVVLAIVLAGGGASLPEQAAAPAILPSAPGAAAASGSTAAPSSASATKVLPSVVNSTPGYLSVPLRSLPRIAGPPVGEGIEPAAETYPAGPSQPSGFTDPVVQSTAVPDAMPAATSFDGLTNQNNADLFSSATGAGSARPPDSEGDVGPTQYVEWINIVMRVYDKTGAPLTAPVAGNAIFSGLPANSLCRTTNDGDPLVTYDQLANRWVLSQFAFAAQTQGPYDQCVAVSTTSDATGTYCLYDFQVSAGSLDDYGKIGVWPDGYYFSFGMFAGGTAYAGPGAMVVERPQMLQAGCPAAKSVFYQIANPQHPEGLPSDVDGPNPPPAGRPNFFMFPNLTNNGLELWKFTVVDWSLFPPLTTFVKNATDVAVPAYDPSITCTDALQNRSCVPQATTPNKLDLVGNRLMYRLVYRNWGSSPPAGIPANTESLVTNETVDADTDHAAVRWYEIRDPNGSPTAFQASTYAPDATSRWMGSAAMDRGANMAVGFTASGPLTTGVDPTPRYAGRLRTDALNTLAQGEADLFGGPIYPVLVATVTAGDQRWGDYSHLTLDPLDDCTFWFINEYQTNNSLFNPVTSTTEAVKRVWGTRIGHFRYSVSACPPTAVHVRTFSARWTAKRISVTWRTAAEPDTLGFNVYRSTDAGPFRRLNPLLIAARRAGSATGAAYSFADRAVRPGRTYTYRLQVVHSNGTREWYGIGAAATRS
jgi:hypothetical protein